jgi:hypothetical protein
MRFREKLHRLVSGRNKAELSRAAKLPETAISGYLAKGSIPRADIAVRLARDALDVPVEWLVDDEQNWPPPDMAEERPLTDVPLSELMMEVVRRYRLEAAELKRAIQEAERVDWEDVWQQFGHSHSYDTVPSEILGALDLLNFIMERWFSLQHRFSADNPLEVVNLGNYRERIRSRENISIEAMEPLVSQLFKRPGVADTVTIMGASDSPYNRRMWQNLGLTDDAKEPA